MAAAARAFTGFKIKCRGFIEELETFSVRLETASEETALQIKHQINHYMNEEWGKLSTCYDELEDRHPEVPPEPQVDVDPVPSERQVLYNNLRRKYSDAKVKVVHKISDLRGQIVPVPVLQLTPAQMANRKKVNREEVVTELKRKLQILKNKADAFVISEYLTGSLELESLCAEVKSLWRSTKVMSEEIIAIDPTNLGEADETQAATDTEVSVVVHPLELKIARLVTSCREEKEKADTAAARAAASTPNTPTGLAPWSGRSNQSLGLERLKLPVFTGKLADYPSFKEDWSHLVCGNLDSHTEMVKIRENVPKADKIELRNLRLMADVWKYLDHEYGRDD